MNISYPHVFLFFSILMFFYYLIFVPKGMKEGDSLLLHVFGNIVVGAFFAGVLTLFVWTWRKALGM